MDGSQPLSKDDMEIAEYIDPEKALILLNKCDLSGVLTSEDVKRILPKANIIETSLISGQGIDEIEDFIESMVYGGRLTQQESIMVNNVRHIELLNKGRDSLKDALEMTEKNEALDFIEIDVKNAYEYLGEIIGETVSDDIIDEVFARFCLGK